MHPRRIIISALVLVALIVCASLISGKYLDNSSKKLENHITELEDSASSGNWDTASNKLVSFKEDWSRMEKIWTVLVDHIEIDNIDNAASRVEKYVDTQNTSMALAEASSLRQYIKHIPSKESFNLKNVF